MEQLVPFVSRKSTLVKVEDRTLARNGYKTDGLLEYLSNPAHQQLGKWTPLEEIVRVFESRNSEAGRQRMRSRLIKAYHVFLERGYLLLRRYSEAGQIAHVKLYDPQLGDDRAFAEMQIDAMQEQCTTRDRRLDRAAAIVGMQLLWGDENEQQ